MSNVSLITLIWTTDWIEMYMGDSEKEHQRKELCRVAHQFDRRNPTLRVTFLHNCASGLIYSYTQTCKDEKTFAPNHFVCDYDFAEDKPIWQAYYKDGKMKTECTIDGLKVSKFKELDESLFATVAKQDEPADKSNIEKTPPASPKLVIIKALENGKTLITIGGTFTYTFDKRKSCIEIVKKLQDGKPHKMENPKRYFQHNEKTIQRVKKSPHNSETKETTITQGDYHKFSEKHLTSDGKGYWRIVSHN
jgi:hypothetical protein